MSNKQFTPKQKPPNYGFKDDDLTPAQWRKAAKFTGFKSVAEYKRWLSLMYLEAGCHLP